MAADTGSGRPLSLKAETLEAAHNVAARVATPILVEGSAAPPQALSQPPVPIPNVVPPRQGDGGDFFADAGSEERKRFEEAVRNGAWDHDDLDLSVPEDDQLKKAAQPGAAQIVIPSAAILFANLPNGSKDVAAGALLAGMADVVDAATKGGADAINDMKENAANAGAQVLKDVHDAAAAHPGLAGLKDVAQTAISSGAKAIQDVRRSATESGEEVLSDIADACKGVSRAQERGGGGNPVSPAAAVNLDSSSNFPSAPTAARTTGDAPFDRYGKAEEPRRSGRRDLTDEDDRHKRRRKTGEDSRTIVNKKAIVISVFLSAFAALVAVGLPYLSGAKSLSIQMPWPGSQADISTFPRGDWRVTYRTDQGVTSTDMIVRRRGSAIYGGGRDPVGDYRIDGQVTSNAVQFAKTYLHGSRQSLPITYKGYVTHRQNSAYWTGSITIEPTRRRLRAPIVKPIGVWESFYTGPRPWECFDFKYFNEDDWREFFAVSAGAMVALGVFAYMLALKVFGLNGWLNQRAKNEYVPSQFKDEHKRVLADFARPLKPGGLPIGFRNEWRPWLPLSPRLLSLPPALRNQNPHVLIVGGTHKGKSRLVAKMAAHDIESGDRGVVVLDSDGSLVDLLIDWIAAHPKGAQLAKRVIILDGSQTSNIQSFNPLAEYGGDLQGLANSVVYGFKAIYTEPPGAQSQWNPQTANILRNAAQVLAANNCTLADLPRLLQDNDYRDILLDRIEKMKHERAEYPMLLESWSQYKKLARTDQWITWVEPILNRLTPSLGDSRIRPLLSNSAPPLDLEALIKEGKILLVRLPKGQLHEAGHLFASLLITCLKHTATLLGAKRSAEPVALYIDEFENVLALETIESLAQESGRAKIGLITVARTLQGVPEEFRQKMTLSFGTIMAFSLAKKDADLLAPQMFRVDGRKRKHTTLTNWVCQVNSSPQIELISDEEKLSVDKLVGQEDRKFFCYKVGSTAGVFHARSFEFRDVNSEAIKRKLVEKMLAGRST